MYVLRGRMSEVINLKKNNIGSCKFMQLAIYIGSTSASDNNKRGEIQNSILMEISMF